MAAEVSLNVRLETPENVRLAYQLAGPALRSAAYAIDCLFRVLLITALLIGACLIAAILPGFTIGGILLALFFIEWLYYIVQEGFWNGYSMGKWLVGIRVIHTSGAPLTFWGAVLRNLLRVADMLPIAMVFEDVAWLGILPFYGPGLLAMSMTQKFQRLGDLAAGTMVVQVHPIVLPKQPMILDHIAPITRYESNGFIPTQAQLSTIAEFLGRRSKLTYQRGHQLASELADTLAERMEFTGDREQVRKFPMAFLARVCATFQTARDEKAAVITPAKARLM
ncbi:RDD family protein [Planctopirus ephydatiae]|uniref:RDD family protein n=1 Tax=Planctopirus ephydatiae TaxID=2528019 RepID=A0A518GIG2_9PLAN|nr:RDD family protein [Planctopirus ephydatiae]QDV28383.1 RDD family protein [Planctopirus ephydatiae]